MFKNINKFVEYRLNKLKDIVLLLIRILIAYGFFEPALNKLKNINDVISWFDSLGIPFPFINAYLSAFTELLGVILLSFGLLVRYISLPLIIILLIAIKTVHLSNGFSVENNGYEIPLYYIIFLLTLFSNGAGKISLDYFIFKDSK